MKLTSRQREQLKRPRPLLFLAILAVFGLPSLLLFRAGLQARKQSAEMDSTADIFLSRFPRQPENAAAQRFDRLAAELGFIPNSGNGLIRVDLEAQKAYQSVEERLDEFVRSQAAKTTGPLDPLPADLSQYLADANVPLAAVQSHLLESPPQWEVDFERMSEINYPMPGFINVLNVQKLLLLSAIDRAQYGRTEQMTQVLEASWRLNQALSERPDLVSQLLVSFTAEQQAGILRQVEGVPVVWQQRLREQSLANTFSVTSGLQFDAWLQYKVLQRSLSPMLGRVPNRQLPPATATFSNRLMSQLFYWFSPAYYLSLSNIDSNRTSQRALTHLSERDFCKTTRPETEQLLAQEKTAVWNRNTLPAITLARRWKDSGDRALTLELTEKILLAKQLSTDGWPTDIPNLESKVCPGERWIYKRSEDGTVTLSFSAQLGSEALVPHFYQAR